jgi:hypothetical protein
MVKAFSSRTENNSSEECPLQVVFKEKIDGNRSIYYDHLLSSTNCCITSSSTLVLNLLAGA